LGAGCAADAAVTDDAPREVREIHDAALTVAKFKDMCEDRGGLTQTHAACSGTNSCRGLIYNSWAGDTIIEHTCRGFNSCTGISCVDMPEDSGKTGEEIYEDLCVGCHSHSEDEDAELFYTVFAKPNADQDAAVDAFEAKSKETLVNNVAFGAVGFYEDGTPYSNMPAYHEDLSLAEVRRVVDYLLDLEAVPGESDALGINAEIDTTGGE
jgi:mono/diheme cytochrome c family protein